MFKLRLKDIKELATTNNTEDITNYNADKMKTFIAFTPYDILAYSSGIYGVNGYVLKNRENGKLYTITKRTISLFMV